MAADFSQAAIYVGTYAKYNAGSLFGKWFDLSDFADKDEFWKRVRNSTRTRTTPNLCFKIEKHTRRTCLRKLDFRYVFELRDKVEDMDTNEQEAFSAWLDYESRDLSKVDADDLVRKFNDEYIGKYDEEEDYAREVIEQCYELSDFVLNYFDYAAFARDLFNDGYKFLDGFVFCA